MSKKHYTPSAWYWVCGGDESQIYSSALPGFIPKNDEGYLAWLDEGGMPTHITSLDDLRDVLLQQYPAGWLKSSAELATDMRAKRDGLIAAVAWRYERHARELRLGLSPTDDLAALDIYVQALADVTKQSSFPSTINWPVAI